MIRLKWLLIAIVLGLACAGGAAFASASSRTEQPFENTTWSTPANVIDAQVAAALAKQGVRLRNPCSDGVFIRRVYLDMIGTLPSPEEVEAFLEDQHPNKRAALIDNLFNREEFADYLTMKWCDLLRVKSEFPIDLWPNAVQAYHRWVYEAVRENRPYNQFVRDLLTSSGSNFRVPQVNFYRAVPGRDPSSIAKAVALTFMGVRFERWPEARRDRHGGVLLQGRLQEDGRMEGRDRLPEPGGDETRKSRLSRRHCRDDTLRQPTRARALPIG